MPAPLAFPDQSVSCIPVDEENDITPRLASHARTAQILMGAIFLLAGIPKVINPDLFYWDVVPYTFLFGFDEQTSALVARSALSLGPIECVLGVALVANWRRRITFPVATALMVAFTAIVGAAWYSEYDESCGCFGTLIERGAGSAVVEDVLMLGLLVLGWGVGGGAAVEKAGSLVTGAAVLSFGIGAVQISGAIERIDDSDLRVGVSLTGLSARSGSVDLNGETVIVVMTPSCTRCKRAMPQLSKMVESHGIRIVGLTYFDQDGDAMKVLKDAYLPSFPIETVSKKDFMRLTWGRGVPRLARLRDGVVEQVWEAHAFPGVKEISGES